jgi:toxin CcdB
MARFDVRRGEDTKLYIDVQCDMLSHLNTRVVIPLMPLDDAPAPGKRLNPVVAYDGEQYAVVTQYLSTVRLTMLGPSEGSLAAEQDRINTAIDMLLYGF